MPKSWKLSDRIRDELSRNGRDIKNWDKDTVELFDYVESQCDGPEWQAAKNLGLEELAMLCQAMGR